MHTEIACTSTFINAEISLMIKVSSIACDISNSIDFCCTMAVALPTICAENPTSADLESDSLELLSDVCSEIELSVGSSQLSINSVTCYLKTRRTQPISSYLKVLGYVCGGHLLPMFNRKFHVSEPSQNSPTLTKYYRPFLTFAGNNVSGSGALRRDYCT